MPKPLPRHVGTAQAWGVYDIQHGLVDVLFKKPKASEIRNYRQEVYEVDIVPVKKAKV